MLNITDAYLLMKEALEEISNPLIFIEKRAKAEGRILSDLAYALAQDPNYLKSIARDVLNKIKEK